MHVYHYSPAEPGAIARLMAMHATREVEVDDLLRRASSSTCYGRPAGAARRRRVVLAEADRAARRVRARRPTMGSGADAVLGYERWRDERAIRPSSTRSPPTTRRTAGRRSRCATGCSPCGRPDAGLARAGRPSRRRGGELEAGERARAAARARWSTGEEPGSRRAGSRASCSSTTAARRGRAGGGGSSCRRWTRTS